MGFGVMLSIAAISVSRSLPTGKFFFLKDYSMSEEGNDLSLRSLGNLVESIF